MPPAEGKEHGNERETSESPNPPERGQAGRGGVRGETTTKVGGPMLIQTVGEEVIIICSYHQEPHIHAS